MLRFSFVVGDADADAAAIRSAAIKEVDAILAERDEKFAVTTRCLEDDDALREWISFNVHGVRVVRAFQFKGAVPWQHEFLDFEWCRHDERRPVVAKATKSVLFRDNAFAMGSSAPGGWYYKVLLRYLRAIKYTCFDRAEHEDNMINLLCHRRRYRGSPGIWKRVHMRDGECWINGKEKLFLSEHQLHYLRKLWELSQKLKTVEITRA